MQYFIELHNVPHEIALYVAELKLFVSVEHYNERYPTYLWVETEWDKDILESLLGVKKVNPKRYRAVPADVRLGRNWTDLLGSRWEIKNEE